MPARLKYTLKQLSHFIAAAETGSFTEAAKQLHVAQPAISSAITKLEAQFGATLLIRQHAQGVRLTPSGMRLLAEARHVLRVANDFQSKASAEGFDIVGDLYLGAYVTLAPVFLPSLISGFKQQHPAVNFKISEGFQDELIVKIMNGEIDMALTYDIDLPDDVEKKILRKATPHAVLPKQHKLTGQDSVALEEIAKEPFILLDIIPAREYFTGLFIERGLPVNIVQRASSLEVLRGMIANDLGVSVLITRPVSTHSYDGLELEIRPITDEIEPMPICMIQLRDVFRTRLYDAFTSYYVSRYDA